MGDRSTDAFACVEENNNEKVEEEEEEEEPEEEQEEEQDSGSSKRKGEVKDDEPDNNPWKLLHEKVKEDVQEAYMKEVQRFQLDRGKTQDYAENAAFNALLSVSRRKLRKTNLERPNELTTSNSSSFYLRRQDGF